MSVYRPGKSPYYQYDFRLDGRRFHGRTGTTSKTVAKRIEATKRAEAIAQKHGLEKRDMTLNAAIGRYWIEVAKDQPSAKNTLYQGRNLLRLLGKDTMLTTIDDDKIAAMISRRRGETRQNAKRKSANSDAGFVSPTTVNHDTRFLRRIMRRARKVWKIGIQEIEWSDHLLPEPDPRDRYLSAAEEERLFAELAPHLVAPVRFSLLTGVRLDNTIKLDWSQVDMQARLIQFRTKSRKPGGRTHTLPLTNELLVLLANQGPKEEGRVFLRDGRPMEYVQTAWRGALKRAGIKDFRWHDMRHTTGTRMVQRGQGIRKVQKMLGHADIKSTLRYEHHELDDLRESMEVLSPNSRTIPEVARRRKMK